MLLSTIRVPLIFLFACLCSSCEAADPDLPNDRRSVEAVVSQRWAAGDFEQLDAMEVAFRTRPRVSASGTSMLFLFYQALDFAQNPADSDESAMQELNRRAMLWNARYPHSQLAKFTEADALMSQAWIARGPGYADETSPKQFADFAHLAKKAADYLVKNKAALARNLNWYRAMLDIALRTSWPERTYAALVQEALDEFPDVMEFYLDPINRYGPKWGGSAPQIAAYIERSTSHLSPPLADEVYAREYSYVIENDFPLVPGAPTFDCARWMRGYDSFTLRYPSAYNANHAALAASFCGDWPHARRFFQQLGSTRPDDVIWRNVFGTPDAFEAKRRWGDGGVE